MNEKRFVLIEDDLEPLILDNKETMSVNEVVDLLNEQQATINKQLDQIIELQDKYRILEFNHSRLEKRNKAQYEKIGEQQAEIERLKKTRLKKTILEDTQENEVKECQFCGEFRTEYHEYEDYSWSAEDYCNAGHYLEDTDPNTCKDYWDE